MIIDNYLDRLYSKKILAQNEKEAAEHVSSGKLSASGLNNPLQWQILKALGVPAKPFDEYTLRKFGRGKDLEAKYLTKIAECVIAEQEKVVYQDTVGIIDAIVDTKEWDFPCGVVPFEIKSVNKMSYDYIVGKPRRQGEGVKKGHALQGALYALAKGTEHFFVSYINTDDERIHTLKLATADYVDEVHSIIERFKKQLASGVVPVFEPVEKWQANSTYNNYPEWSTLNEAEIAEKLQAFVNGKSK